MIVYVVAAHLAHTLARALPLLGPDLAARVRIATYDTLLRQRRWPMAHYIFAELESLPPDLLARAEAAWRRLEAHGAGMRLLNDPARVKARYELLRTLAAAGRNDYGVYRLDEAREPRRFPVFLRAANDHDGPIGDLIDNARDLAGAVERLAATGCFRTDRLIVEFAAVADADGLFRKYGAYVVGGAIVPEHMYAGAHWMLKPGSNQRAGARPFDRAAIAREELAYVRANPHAEALRAIAALARIDYGRIDYGLAGGRVQVWEINTNPDPDLGPDPPGVVRAAETRAHFVAAFRAALLAIDTPIAAGGRVLVRPRKWRWLRRWTRTAGPSPSG